MEVLCFFAGVAWAYGKGSAPLFIVLIVFLFRPAIRWLFCFAAGVMWCLLHNGWLADSGMPHVPAIHNAVLEGYVISLPKQQAHKTQFQCKLTRLNQQPVVARVLLSCYQHCPVVQIGQHIQVKAQLNKPRNFLNPGGFDYQRWLAIRHIHWTGVINSKTYAVLSKVKQSNGLLNYRNHLAESQKKLSEDEMTLGIIQALTLGITDKLSKASWDLFRRTGTTHLMVISGAHIGLVAGITYWLIKHLWCCLGRACLIIPAQRMASIVAMLMALGYALLSGFAVPAQRSLIACLCVLLRFFCNRPIRSWQGWRYAVLLVLLMEPHAVAMPGFYLSFLAVACLLLVSQRFPRRLYSRHPSLRDGSPDNCEIPDAVKDDEVRNRDDEVLLERVKKSQAGVSRVSVMTHRISVTAKTTLIAQLACLLGLMPLTLYFFSYGAVNGLLANLLAIPLVGFVIVPLALVATIIGQWFDIPGISTCLQTAIALLTRYLHAVDAFSAVNLTYCFSIMWVPVALTCVLYVLVVMPIRPFIPALLVLVASCFFLGDSRVNPGEAVVDVLDVGQGLAVAIRTANHTLLYDTGTRFYRGSDMGKLVVIPYLISMAIKKIDTIVISHSDLDHRGGMSSIVKQYPVGALISENPSYYKRGFNCHQYRKWIWDGVSFRFFAIESLIKGKNNHSCVLQISTQASQILLTGDIEKTAEDYLVAHYGKQLTATYLLIPHHGSKTSSSKTFVSQVAPDFAIASFGLINRYHFPHAQAMKVYQKQAIEVFTTAQCGMIRVPLVAKQPRAKPVCYQQ